MIRKVEPVAEVGGGQRYWCSACNRTFVPKYENETKKCGRCGVEGRITVVAIVAHPTGGHPMTAPELVKEFYPDAYVVPTKGGFIVRGTWNGLRFNRLHAEPEETPEAAWDAVVERMNSEATQ